MKRKARKIGIDVVTYLLMGIAAFVAIAPIVWLFLMSIKPQKLLYTLPPPWIFSPVIDHYINIFTRFPFERYIFNSVGVTLLTTVITLVISLPAAYSIARFRTGGENFSFWILSIRMLPPIIFAVPMFVLMQSYRLLDTWGALIFVYLTFNIPIAVWVLRSFIEELSPEYEEAALIDGCSRLGVMIKIVFPLISPAIIATAVLTFIFSWNEFLFALILTFEQARTLPLGAAQFATGRAIHWGEVASAGTIAIIPTMTAAILMKKYLVRGLTMGTVREEI